MELKEKGSYVHFTDSLLVVEENNSYNFVSHVYVMQDGSTHIRYERKENNLVKLKESLNKIK